MAVKFETLFKLYFIAYKSEGLVKSRVSVVVNDLCTKFADPSDSLTTVEKLNIEVIKSS